MLLHKKIKGLRRCLNLANRLFSDIKLAIEQSPC
jgi:hypothetical protein